MFRRNVDFFGVAAIALAMLAFSAARSWHFGLDFNDAVDSIRIEKAIDIQTTCPTTRQVLLSLSSIFR